MPELYRLATDGLSLENKKIVQRRIKEAVLKGVILYGVPRSAQALGPLYKILPDEEIDTYGPRYVNTMVLWWGGVPLLTNKSGHREERKQQPKAQ